MKSKLFSTAATTTTADEVQIERPGITCWDFAYPTGKCSLSPGKTRIASKARRRTQDQRRSTSSILGSITAPAAAKESTATRTYLLSSPTPWSIMYPQTYTTLSTLLATPHTQIVLLVPQSQMTCSRVSQFSRLARVGGSGIQILPVPDQYPMSCEPLAGGASGSPSEAQVDVEGELVLAIERAGVDEVVRKIIKHTKVRAFDGYLALEDDRASWKFLEAVGEGVKAGKSLGLSVSGRR